MGDRRRAERTLQADMPKRLREENDQLTDGDIKFIVDKSTQVWMLFGFMGPVNERRIDVMCEMLMPYLTQILYGGPKGAHLRGHDVTGRKVYTGNEHAA